LLPYLLSGLFIISQLSSFRILFHSWGPKTKPFSRASLAIPALDFRIWKFSRFYMEPMF